MYTTNQVMKEICFPSPIYTLTQWHLYVQLACFLFFGTEILLLLLTIQVELLACSQVGTPLLAKRRSELLGTCSGEVELASWGGGVLRSRLAW